MQFGADIRIHQLIDLNVRFADQNKEPRGKRAGAFFEKLIAILYFVQ